MKKLTNYTSGPRGVSLKDGSTQWVAPGETLEVDPKQVVEPLPDLGQKPDNAADADKIEALEAENAELRKQVEDQGRELTALKADLEKATAPKK